ncbi:MAG: response regulator [Halieaceae bacterium]|nr:response regulator [Halieaceae bacterium]
MYISLRVLAALVLALAPLHVVLGDEADFAFSPSPINASLTQQNVRETFQSSSGHLWLLTQDGLNRYDGTKVEQYQYSLTNALSISSNDVTGIAEDLRGTVWVSTVGGGLNRFHEVQKGFSKILFDPANPGISIASDDIYAIHADTDGHIWLGHDNAITRFDPINDEYFHFRPNLRAGEYWGRVNNFAESYDGLIWIATESGGVLRIEGHKDDTGQISPIAFMNASPGSSPPEVSSIAADDNVIWIGTSGFGITRLNREDNSYQLYGADEQDYRKITSSLVRSLFIDESGNLWAATANGLCLKRSASSRFNCYSQINSDLPSDGTYGVFESREGVLWVGTEFGLAVGISSGIASFDAERNGFSDSSVNAFAQTGPNTLWVGTDDGLNNYDFASGDVTWITRETFPSISDTTVMSLLGHKNTLWVGTFEGGLNVIDLSTGETDVFQHNPEDPGSIGANGITSITATISGQILVGTYGGGIGSINPGDKSFRNYRYNPDSPRSISSNNVLAVFQDSLGYVWIGTQDGLNRLDLDTGIAERYYSERGNINSLSSNLVWEFHEDEQGNLWIGTAGGGLNMWSLEDRKNNNPTFSHYSENVSLPSASIYGVQEDANGSLWLSHNKGLTQLDAESLEARHYDIVDGLQHTEFNMGASFTDQLGRVYFGGPRGFNQIQANNQIADSPPPQIEISEIRIMNEVRTIGENYADVTDVFLDYQDTMISVDFFAADYSNPALVQYAYKLEGLNEDWIISRDASSASFTTLPAGTHKLSLAASNSDGVWNWNGREINVHVSPPPWLSPWAYALYVLAALSVIYLILLRQKRQSTELIARQRELEDRVAERTNDLEIARRAAVDANNAKSEFLATMSHEIRTPMHGMIGMTELLMNTGLTKQQSRFAESALASGRSLLGLINEILDYSKIEAGKAELTLAPLTVSSIVDDVAFLNAHIAQRKGLNLTTVVSPSRTTLLGDEAKIRQVLTNLLSNAIKFTEAGTISIRVQEQALGDKHSVSLTVNDSGIGIESSKLGHIFEVFTQADASTSRQYGGTGLGLSISKSLVELMGGTMSIESRLGKGTSVSVDIALEATNLSDDSSLEEESAQAAIVCADKDRKAMICSHLVRAGFEIMEHRESSVHDRDGKSLELTFLDYEEIEQSNEHSTVFRAAEQTIVGAPLGLQDKFSDVCRAVLPYPITEQNLREALTELRDHRHQALQPASDVSINHRPAQDITSVQALVAEDVPLNQEITREMLQILGLSVEFANNGLEAIEKYGTGQFDIVFMDCQMPVLDGYAATAGIREHENATGMERTPVVAVSASTSEESVRRAYEAGVDGYIAKPFTIEDLKTVLQDHGLLTHEQAYTRLSDAPDIDHSARDQEPDNSSTVLDKPTINGLLDLESQLNKAMFQPMVEGFQAQSSALLTEMQSASSGQDTEALRKAAHALKSMSANIGALNVKLLSEAIERKCKRNPDTFPELDLDVFRDAIDEFSRASSTLGRT